MGAQIPERAAQEGVLSVSNHSADRPRQEGGEGRFSGGKAKQAMEWKSCSLLTPHCPLLVAPAPEYCRRGSHAWWLGCGFESLRSDRGEFSASRQPSRSRMRLLEGPLPGANDRRGFRSQARPVL